MGYGVTVIFCMVIGAGVAVALYVTEPEPETALRRFRVTTAVVLWPLYVPIILAGPRSLEAEVLGSNEQGGDELARSITRGESELDSALTSLDGWAEGVLAREAERIGELRAGWTSQAARIRAMDSLLVQNSGHDEPDSEVLLGARPGPSSIASDLGRQSKQARQANCLRLQDVRNRSYNDLMETLARVRELVSMIHLAKFTGEPVTRTEELVAQIAAAVEGVSAVT